MDKYEENFPASSVSAVILMLPFALMAGQPELTPQNLTADRFESYHLSEVSASNSAMIGDIYLSASDRDQFHERLTELFSEMAGQQVALGSDIEAILDDNLDTLYEL